MTVFHRYRVDAAISILLFLLSRASQRSQWCGKVLGWWTSTRLSDYSSTVSIQAFVTLRHTISLEEQRGLLCLPFTCSLSSNLIYKQQIWLLCGSQTKLMWTLLCCLLVIESQMSESPPPTGNKDTHEILDYCQPTTTHLWGQSHVDFIFHQLV